MPLDWRSIYEKSVVGIITAVALGALALLWNWGSQGGLVRALGGVTQKDVADIVRGLAVAGPPGPPGPRGEQGTKGDSGLFSNVLPGAVVAFDLAPPHQCPLGWTIFKEATSRVIVGAGNSADFYEEKYAHDGQGNLLPARAYRQHGGGETRLFLMEEVSEAAANVRTTAGNLAVGYRRAAASTNDVGARFYRNVISPYIALYYCRKD
jgi:hypothetical protein